MNSTVLEALRRPRAKPAVKKLPASRALQSNAIDWRRGEITPQQFESRMSEQLDRLFWSNGAAARGGESWLSKEDRSLGGKELRFQKGRLKKFVKQAAGDESYRNSKAFLNRVAMYGKAPRLFYENVRRADYQERGFTVGRRVRHAKESCAVCIAEAARGWVAIKEMKSLGDSTCIVNCKCTQEFAKPADLTEFWRLVSIGATKEINEALRGNQSGLGILSWQFAEIYNVAGDLGTVFCEDLAQSTLDDWIVPESGRMDFVEAAIREISEMNPYRDKLGRFASGPGAATFGKMKLPVVKPARPSSNGHKGYFVDADGKAVEVGDNHLHFLASHKAKFEKATPSLAKNNDRDVLDTLVHDGAIIRARHHDTGDGRLTSNYVIPDTPKALAAAEKHHAEVWGGDTSKSKAAVTMLSRKDDGSLATRWLDFGGTTGKKINLSWSKASTEDLLMRELMAQRMKRLMESWTGVIVPKYMTNREYVLVTDALVEANPFHDRAGRFASATHAARISLATFRQTRAGRVDQSRVLNAPAKPAAKGKAGPRVEEEKPMSDIARRAKEAHTVVGKAIQDYGEAQETLLASKLGGRALPNNEPADVIAPRRGTRGRGHHAIEVKTLTVRKENKVDMKASAVARKRQHTAATGDPFHTVVFDHRDRFNDGAHKGDYSGHEIYYRRGVGTVHIGAMHKVKSFAELKRLLEMPETDLPKGAKPNNSGA